MYDSVFYHLNIRSSNKMLSLVYHSSLADTCTVFTRAAPTDSRRRIALQKIKFSHQNLIIQSTIPTQSLLQLLQLY